MNINARLKRLEKRTGAPSDVLLWIGQGKYYDELNGAQKDIYTQYATPFITHEEWERFMIMCAFPEAPADFIHTEEDLKDSGIFHFPLEVRKISKEISEETRKELEEYLNHKETPEEEAERKALEKELRNISQMRQKAIAQDSDPNQYKAPWQHEYIKSDGI